MSLFTDSDWLPDEVENIASVRCVYHEVDPGESTGMWNAEVANSRGQIFRLTMPERVVFLLKMREWGIPVFNYQPLLSQNPMIALLS